MASDDTLVGPPGATAQAGGLGQLVANRYRIVRWLGGGGMGRVYEAFDTELTERVALKVLRGGLSDELLERFRREVRLTRRIQHRNVARMFDIGDHAGERFLTMELVDGEPLSREIAQRPAWAGLRDLAVQICEGLAAAHAAGVVHRDLKPDNVLVETATGRAVITDFGIARGREETTMTQVGMIVGTPRYMAPEQLAGGAVDARADLFSLGALLFELAIGTPPWDGDSPVAIAVAQATQPPRAFASRSLPASLGDLLARCLALDPDRRPASAAELAAALAAITHEPSRSARPTMPPARPTPRPEPLQSMPADTTIAVLPFDRCAPEDRYLADGLREDLIDALSVTAGLRVRPASTTVPGDPREAGRQLGVDHVVAGALVRTPTGLRVSARLVGIADGFQIWAQKLTCSEAEILAVSDTITRGIADALSMRAVSMVKPVDARAVELYLRARELLRGFWGDNATRAATLLDEAAARAPDSGQILGARAYAHVHAWSRISTPDRHASARVAVDEALATGSGEAYLASGMLRLNTDDPVGAARDYRIALVRAPMSAAVHEHVGRLLVEIDPSPEGRKHLETALQLDPTRDLMITSDFARLAALRGDWDETERLISQVREHPDPAISTGGMLYSSRFASWRGEVALSVDELARIGPRMHPAIREAFELLERRHATGALDPGVWRAALARVAEAVHATRTRLVMTQRMAEFATVIGEREAAMLALETAAALGVIDIVWADLCPALAPLRADPRWSATRAPIAERAGRVRAAFHSALG